MEVSAGRVVEVVGVLALSAVVGESVHRQLMAHPELVAQSPGLFKSTVEYASLFGKDLLTTALHVTPVMEGVKAAGQTLLGTTVAAGAIELFWRLKTGHWGGDPKVPGYRIESTVVGGTEVGVQAIDEKTEAVVATYYTQMHSGESRRAGTAVVRGRAEVDEGHRGKGLGTVVVKEAMRQMERAGRVTHQESFTQKGERSLKPVYDKKGYKQMKDVEGVFVKDY